MLNFSSRVRTFVARQAVDFRRGFDGLRALVRDVLCEDPVSGHVFVFFNRRRDRVKLLVWDRNGFWLFYKRLERGTFESVTSADPTANRVEVDRARLSLLLDGIRLESVKFRDHFGRELRPTNRGGEQDNHVDRVAACGDESVRAERSRGAASAAATPPG